MENPSRRTTTCTTAATVAITKSGPKGPFIAQCQWHDDGEADPSDKPCGKARRPRAALFERTNHVARIPLLGKRILSAGATAVRLIPPLASQAVAFRRTRRSVVKLLSELHVHSHGFGSGIALSKVMLILGIVVEYIRSNGAPFRLLSDPSPEPAPGVAVPARPEGSVMVDTHVLLIDGRPAIGVVPKGEGMNLLGLRAKIGAELVQEGTIRRSSLAFS